MGKKYCEVCFKRCKGYTIRIEESVYVHNDCFKCHECESELEISKFYLKNKCLYCIKDFKKLFYPKCYKCAQIIDGEMVTVMGQQYHFNCLCCSFCNKTSKPGDKMNFDGKNLICRVCTADALSAKSVNHSTTETQNKQIMETRLDNSINRTHLGRQSVDILNDSKEIMDGKTKDTNAKPFSKEVCEKDFIHEEKKEQMSDTQLRNAYEHPSKIHSHEDADPMIYTTYLDKPSDFKRAPSLNVAHTLGNIHHFHVPESSDRAQKFSRAKSKTMPKSTVIRPYVDARKEKLPLPSMSPERDKLGQGLKLDPKIRTVPVFESRSQQSKSPLKDEKATSRETLSKTPLPCISEDEISVTSYTSIRLPPKGFALKPGYGLKPVIYALYGTSPDSKQHLFSGTISVDDSKETKSISMGSEYYGSFYSMDEEKLDPYTGLKRNKSTRSTITHDPRVQESKTLTEVINSRRPITINHFLKKVNQDGESRGNVKKYSHLELKNLLTSSSSKLIDRDHLENYLLDAEFKKIFSMDKAQFKQLPEWRKVDLKKKHSLS